jgi:hypothetical protein
LDNLNTDPCHFLTPAYDIQNFFIQGKARRKKERRQYMKKLMLFITAVICFGIPSPSPATVEVSPAMHDFADIQIGSSGSFIATVTARLKDESFTLGFFEDNGHHDVFSASPAGA